MKITMITTAAGPDGTYHAGKTYDVTDEFGRDLVAGKYAIEGDGPKTAPKQPAGRPAAPGKPVKLPAE